MSGPKYYYYYEWMTERIHEGHPMLEEPVLDKLLTMDAGELDLMLAFPEAMAAQVAEYERVLAAWAPSGTPTTLWSQVGAMGDSLPQSVQGSRSSRSPSRPPTRPVRSRTRLDR